MTERGSNNIGSKRRSYPDDLKREAVRMLADGHSAPSIAERLGLSSPNLVYTWRKQFQVESPLASQDDDQLRALRDELARTQRERDILKKALAIFSRQT